MADVVPLRDAAPLLTDIPGMLRRAADQIEAGTYGAVGAAFLLLPDPDGYPRIFGWGDVEGQNHPIIQCELAKAWLVNNIVARS
jgi:hypothetical protein